MLQQVFIYVFLFHTTYLDSLSDFSVFNIYKDMIEEREVKVLLKSRIALLAAYKTLFPITRDKWCQVFKYMRPFARQDKAIEKWEHIVQSSNVTVAEHSIAQTIAHLVLPENNNHQTMEFHDELPQPLHVKEEVEAEHNHQPAEELVGEDQHQHHLDKSHEDEAHNDHYQHNEAHEIELQGTTTLLPPTNKSQQMSLYTFFQLCDILYTSVSAEEKKDKETTCQICNNSIPFLHYIANHWLFNFAFIIVNTVSCGIIVLEVMYSDDTANAWWLILLEAIIMACFAFEIMFKLLAYGAVLYFSDKWQM